MQKIPVIYDGDMGGDDLWAIAALLGQQDRFDLKGITTVFGNVSCDLATKNVMNFINALGYGHIPVAAGASRPRDGHLPFGDDAYGEHGVGGVILPDSPYKPVSMDAVEWAREQLLSTTDKTTIFVTGPATNMAELVYRYPDITEKIDRFIIMAGADQPPGKDSEPVTLENGDIRRGNITPHAEFNAFQDPAALNLLVMSGVDCHFLTMDSNQHLILNERRKEQFRRAGINKSAEMLQMMEAVTDLDKSKFHVDGAFIHDPNVITYALHPEWYAVSRPAVSFKELPPGEKVFERPTARGEAVLSVTKESNVHWAHRLNEPDKAYGLMLDSFAKSLGQSAQPR